MIIQVSWIVTSMIFEPIHFSWRFSLNTAYTLEAIASLHISFHPNSKKFYQRFFGTKVQVLITQIFGSGNFCKIGASLLCNLITFEIIWLLTYIFTRTWGPKCVYPLAYRTIKPAIKTNLGIIGHFIYTNMKGNMRAKICLSSSRLNDFCGNITT